MIFRVLDIETIPDLSCWANHDKPTYKLAPGRSIQEGPVRGFSPLVEQSDPFPPPQAQRVVSISYVDIVFDAEKKPRYQYDRCYTECRWGLDEASLDVEEAKLLRTFAAAMAVNNGDVQVVHLVSWNGRTFDLPVLVLRSLHHRIPCLWYYAQTNVRYRYSAEGHCDLMDYLADFGACRQMTLNDACRLVGLPGKTDMSGANVHDLYKSTLVDPRADRYLEPAKEDPEVVKARVARYCLQDSIQTALLFIISRHHIGKITTETYNAIIDTFKTNPSITQAIDLDWDRLRL